MKKPPYSTEEEELAFHVHVKVMNSSTWIMQIAQELRGAFHRKAGERDWWGLTALQREKVKFKMTQIRNLADEVLEKIEEEDQMEAERAREAANQT